MESQTHVSKGAPQEFRNWRVKENPPTLCQPFANPSPTLRQPFLPTFSANPLVPWTPGTCLETRVNVFLGRAEAREGVNREKLTVKKIINNEMFFFHRFCPL